MTHKITLFLMIWLLALNGAGFYDGTPVPRLENVAPEAEEIAVFEMETDAETYLLTEYELPDTESANRAASQYSAMIHLMGFGTGCGIDVRIRTFENEGICGVTVWVITPRY